jgi:hypothetical protein
MRVPFDCHDPVDKEAAAHGTPTQCPSQMLARPRFPPLSVKTILVARNKPCLKEKKTQEGKRKGNREVKYTHTRKHTYTRRRTQLTPSVEK